MSRSFARNLTVTSIALAGIIVGASSTFSADPRRTLTVTIPVGHTEAVEAVRAAFRDGGWVIMRERPDTVFAMPYRLDHYPYVELVFKVVLTPSDSSTLVTLSGKMTDLRVWRVKAIEEKIGSGEMAFAWSELSRFWLAVKTAHPGAT